MKGAAHSPRAWRAAQAPFLARLGELSDPPTMAEDLAVLRTLNELIATLKRAQGILTQRRGAAEAQR